MTTTRTPIGRAAKAQITPLVVELFNRREELATDQSRRREYLAARTELRQTLGLKPFAFVPCDGVLDEPRPSYIDGLCSGRTWDKAYALRRALQARAEDVEELT